MTPGADRTPIERLIVALDVPSSQTALDLAGRLRGHVGLFKVGLELFSAEGPALVRALTAEGARIFLDLKLHDIPNTVRGAARAAARLGVTMATVHASGGLRMMQAAAQGAREGSAGGRVPLVLGVTALTSLTSEDLGQIGWSDSSEDVVLRLAGLARSAGLDGVVASPQEACAIRKNLGPGFLIVTPGIRPVTASQEDQARAATPRAALDSGADYLVVGRPITQASDPASAADAIVEEMRLARLPRSLEATRG
jgi:orotidine-5'-phosphate decarboxylase